MHLLLRGLGLLNAAVALFAATTVLGLFGTFLVPVRSASPASVGLAMMIAGVASLLLLLASTVTFFQESACGRALLRLHRRLGEGADSERERPRTPGVTETPVVRRPVAASEE